LQLASNGKRAVSKCGCSVSTHVQIPEELP
jgi:hypothetical protein